MLCDPKWNAKVNAEPWRQVLLSAANLIERIGWCQHTERDSKGRVCASEALMRVAADDVASYALAVTRLSDFVAAPMSVPEWNDVEGRTATEVKNAMRICARQRER